MSKDPMGDLFENSGITEEELNEKLNNIGDGFDLSRGSKQRSKGKSQPYDLHSLVDAEINSEDSARGIVHEEERMDNNGSRESNGNKRKLREGLGLPSREELFDDDNDYDTGPKKKRTLFGKRKSNQDEYDDFDGGESQGGGQGGQPEKEGKMWKILAALGLAAYVNNIVNKVTGSKGGEQQQKRRTPLEHIATIVAILVGCAIIISFSFYIMGVIGNQNISSIPGFNEKIDYLLNGRGEKDINVTGLEMSSFTKPYRNLDDGTIEVIGKYDERLIFPANALSSDRTPTGYVYVIYTEDAYTGDVINVTLQEIDLTKDKNINYDGPGPKQTIPGVLMKAKDKISEWISDLKGKP